MNQKINSTQTKCQVSKSEFDRRWEETFGELRPCECCETEPGGCLCRRCGEFVKDPEAEG
jgi:hypothetical protein